MQASGFANAQITKYLILSLIASSILASATDSKHYFYLPISKFLSHPTRILHLPFAIQNSTLLLFTTLSLYHLRQIERLFGSRKFLSLIITSYGYTTFASTLLCLVLSLVLPPALAKSVYIPGGPIAIVYAVLAQWHAAVPALYKYRIGDASSDENQTEGRRGWEIELSSKSWSYLLPAQMALSDVPGSLMLGAIGWVVGYAWRAELLPGSGWRVPKTLLGSEAARSRERVEDVRRRLRDGL